jgi:serine phosphatase RsbU (regulator of sigma subunit)
VQDTSVTSEPLGPAASAQIATGEVHLGHGSLMVLIGPSMLEARGVDGRAFVDEAFDRILQDAYGNLPELVDRIMEGFRAFTAKSPYFTPDLTVVALERAKET